MRTLWIACGIMALGLAVGCKKNEGDTAGTTGTTETTASTPTGKEGPVAAPDAKETGGDKGAAAVTMESVAGTYDSQADDATKAELEKAGHPWGGGSMTFKADGTFEAEVKVGDAERKTKGTFTVEGDSVTTVVSEIDGKPAETQTPQKYTVGADGNLSIPGMTGVTFIKK